MRLLGGRRGRRGRRGRPADPARYPEGPVRELAAAPPAGPRTPWTEVDFLSVDLETTGLDPRRDHVLAVGWVPVRGGEVVLSGARETAVRPPAGVEVGDSAVVHRLTDDAVAAAPEVDAVLAELLGALRGHVLLAHHAPVELDFLGRAARRLWGSGLPLTAVDTMRLHHRLRQGVTVGDHGTAPPGSLRLDAARRGFGLPRYAAHRPLTDAIATAELLLAQAAELAERLGRPPTLADLSPKYRR